jgi:hypothetical protein
LYKTLNYFLTHYFVVDFDKATGYLFIPVVTGGSFREFAPHEEDPGDEVVRANIRSVAPTFLSFETSCKPLVETVS